MFNPQLATFVCVADCGSFSQAAEKLYLSSTAVMKQLNALERHLELKLLERTRRGTVLTPAGEVIYRYARQMFADSDRALREAGLQAKLILQVHDELIVECPPEETEQVRAIVTGQMESVAQLSVPLVAEAKVGRTWYEAK